MRSHVVFSGVFKSLAALAVLSAVASVARAEAPRWKFKTGEELNYVLERNADGKMSLAGSEFSIKMGMTFDTTWRATAVDDDGTAHVEQTVDRIQVSMSSPLAGDVNYDSAAAAGKPAGPVWTLLGPMVEGMLGQTFKLKVSPLGEVSDIELPKKLADGFAKQQVGQNRQAGVGIGANPFSEKGIKDLITQTVLPLPEKAEADVTWMQSFSDELPFLGTETAETTFSLAGDEMVDGKKLCKISAATELLFEPAENPRAELEIMEQEAEATYYFDAEAGHLVKSAGSERAVKELTGQQEVSQDITETVSMRLGKSPPPGETKDNASEEKK